MTDGTFTLKIDQETEGKLESISKSTERSKSAVIRWLILQEYSNMTGTVRIPMLGKVGEGEK